MSIFNSSSSYFISLLVFFYANHVSINDASTGFITLQNISTVDLDLLIMFGCIFGGIFFIPIFCSVFFVFKRPRSMRAERTFNDRWYRWSKQYIWHEYIFRTCILIIMALIVIFIFEEDWPFWAPFAVIGSILFCCLLSKCVASCIKPRILTKEQKKRLFKMAMDESMYIHKQNVTGQGSDGTFSYSLNDNAYDDKAFANDGQEPFSFKKNIIPSSRGYGSNVISRMSFKRNKSYKDKSSPLLMDYNADSNF
mmetsp:Transcript_5463/g.4767  ORF Transcript_5463/g.4767 Transcript_5463/m.4767 type:complete len:252 (-) Transcript_5463:253-1008(-)